MAFQFFSVAAYMRGRRSLVSARPASMTAGSDVHRMRGSFVVPATVLTALPNAAGSPDTERMAIAFRASFLPM